MKTTTKETYVVNPEGDKHIALIDMGNKAVLEELKKKNYKVTVFGANTGAEEILDLKADAILISDGPGNPLDAPGTAETVKELFGKIPVCGIAMGHQIIGIALGGKIQKLTYGHHGANQPVKDMITGKAYVTSQNHNYIVTDLPEDVTVTFKNINDGSIEGIAHNTLSIKSVQFHPEAAPGSLDIDYLLDSFMKEVK